MHGSDRGPVEVLFWCLPEMPWEDYKKTVTIGGPQACISSLDFPTMKLEVRTRASYWIQTIINIAEEDKSVANSWKTLL